VSAHEDRWGFDPGFARRAGPLAGLLYDHYWRVAAHGAETVPREGPAMLVANRAGPVAWDALLIAGALQRARHPRRLRLLLGESTFALPWVSIAARRLGGVPETAGNAERLLREGELVCTVPSETAFGTGEFAATALRAGAPIVPVALARLPLPLGLPEPPVPMPVPPPGRWRIGFGAPIAAVGDADDPAAVLALADDVREQLRKAIYDTLARREGAM
jgi:1-acyl-sn-glycerol-3-phosphate acyltransferase